MRPPHALFMERDRAQVGRMATSIDEQMDRNIQRRTPQAEFANVQHEDVTPPHQSPPELTAQRAVPF